MHAQAVRRRNLIAQSVPKLDGPNSIATLRTPLNRESLPRPANSAFGVIAKGFL